MNRVHSFLNRVFITDLSVRVGILTRPTTPQRHVLLTAFYCSALRKSFIKSIRIRISGRNVFRSFEKRAPEFEAINKTLELNNYEELNMASSPR